MKCLLFRARRSSILQWFVLICFSVFTGMLIAAAVIARIMLHFGMQYDPMTGENNFSDWLTDRVLEYDSAYSFFMSMRAILMEMVNSWNVYIWVLAASVMVLILMFCYLIASAGYHGKEKKPCLRGLERIPFDISLPVLVTVLLILHSLLLDYVYYNYWVSYAVMGGICAGMAEIFCAVLLLRLIAAKTRTGTLFSGMITVRLFRAVGRCIRGIPFIWKAALIWGSCLSVLYLFGVWLCWMIFYDADLFVLLWTAVVFLVFIAGIWVILQMNLVKQKAHQLAEGDLESSGAGQEAKTDLQKQRELPLLPAFRSCLEDLDRISDGMNIIVDEKMKSERFQTELITNVSHDIKTPLTSIINYLDFLSQEEKKENRNPQVVQEYIEVLDRQSVRLKKLIEDLIEASKASTGSLSISKEPCELGIFLQQLAGEYEERLERAGLKLNMALPEEKIYVEADGRYLWRVLDNLLQNVCKYAMAGTRVYLQLQKKAGQAIIVIKNISASELNIQPEELMERFVRGDRSRHTEGSGLGLSIAKSLTELQGGKFAIEVDGDLFKTAVGFPVIDPPAVEEAEKTEQLPEKTGETNGGTEYMTDLSADDGSVSSSISLLQNEV
ncbi:MAG: sensor histidine kinase [Lachnospiraceae bacterium]